MRKTIEPKKEKERNARPRVEEKIERRKNVDEPKE